MFDLLGPQQLDLWQAQLAKLTRRAAHNALS
jgi:hypothetical protein